MENQQGFIFTLQLTGTKPLAEKVFNLLIALAILFDGLECLGFIIQEEDEDGKT